MICRQVQLGHVNAVADEIIPEKSAVQVVTHAADQGAGNTQPGSGYHAGGYLPAALPAGTVEKAAGIAGRDGVQIHRKIHAGTVYTKYIKFHRRYSRGHRENLLGFSSLIFSVTKSTMGFRAPKSMARPFRL